MHLTPEFVKIVERGIDGVFVISLSELGYGENALILGKSNRDVLVIDVCSRLFYFEDGFIVGLYYIAVS